jgi:alpha-L-fucosidase
MYLINKSYIIFIILFTGGLIMEIRNKNINSEEAREERIKWFREAKFGLFIHWGLYCIPAGEWNGEKIPSIGEWIMKRARIPVAEYEKLADVFNPVDFDADAWAQMAVDAGMKYVVITAKHHDGFALYQSSISKYNIVDATPFKRDVVKELAAACSKRGIRFGIYYSQAQDWHEPNGAGNDWDFVPNEEKDFDEYLKNKAITQIEELLTGYGPMCLIWFDTPVLMNNERSKPFIDMIREKQPDCLIDGRLGASGDYASTGDNRIPPIVMKGDWETPATLNDTWGFKKDDNNWKPTADLVFKLVDIVSKGGNYLLNVGPDAYGVIPAQSVENLIGVGKWLKVNGEAIYGAGPSPFGYEFGTPTGEVDNRGIQIYNAEEKWRCTTKADKIFIHIFKWPEDGKFVLEGMKNNISGIYFLADKKESPIEFSQLGDKVSVKLPDTAIDPLGTVICIK